MSSLLLLTVALTVSPPAGLWEELTPAPGPEELDGATWFDAPPASHLLLDLVPGEVPVVWRVDVGEDGHPLSRVEHLPRPAGGGRFLVWVSPAPAARWAICASGRVKVYLLRPVYDDLAPSEWPDEYRLELPAGSPWLVRSRPREPRTDMTVADGESAPLSVRGPARLRIDARVQGAPSPRPVPFELFVGQRTAGEVPPGLSSSARIPPEGDRFSMPRRLELQVPRGVQHWEMRAEGAPLQIRVWSFRPRSRFPTPPGHALAGGDLSGPAMAEDGSEAALMAHPGAAARELRRAARYAWLQDSAYQFEGVVHQGTTEQVRAVLPAHHVLSQPDGDGRLPAGVRAFLPAGRPVTVQVPAVSDGWSVLHCRGVNLSGRDAVVSLTVDGAEPQRVLLTRIWTDFRVAIPPGEHRLELAVPAGADDTLSVAVDLPVDGAAGPFGDPWSHLREMTAGRLDREPARVELPPTGGPAHLRLDAWWSGSEPRELILRSDEGVRRVLLQPGHAGPTLARDDGTLLSAGAAAVHLDIDASWVEIAPADDLGPLWFRVATRRPIPPEEVLTAATVDAPSEDLAELTRRCAVGGTPQDRLDRAARLLDLGFASYARRDIEAASVQLGDDDERVLSLRAAARQLGSSDHVRIVNPDAGPFFPLDLAAAAGSGGAGWLDSLPAESQAARIAVDRLAEAAATRADPAPIHLEMARRALDDATRDERAALRALVFAAAAGEVLDAPEVDRIAARAAQATRPDALTTASTSGHRVRLRGPRPESRDDPLEAVRRDLLGAPLQRADRILRAGSRWKVELGAGTPAELPMEVFCDDLRVPGPADRGDCQVEIRIGDRAPDVLSVPRGELKRTTLSVKRASELEIGLAPQGHARYLAVGLGGPDWRPPDPWATFQVASPGQPVTYRVVGPNVLTAEIAPRAGASTPTVQLRVDGKEPACPTWREGASRLVSDRGAVYGPARQLKVLLLDEGVSEVQLQASGGDVAVRLSHRLPAELVLADPPRHEVPLELAPSDEAAPPQRADADTLSGLPRLPRPSRGGTVEGSVRLWQRWVGDERLSGQPHRYLEVAAAHRLGIGRSTFLQGGLMARLWPDGSPSAGVRLGALHRFRPVDLRIQGRVNGVVQQVGDSTMGALSLRLRLDRPTRLGPGLTLVPHVGVRGYVQPSESLSEWRKQADIQIASNYRRAHPFALDAGASLLWRPWVDAEWVVGLRARSNPDPRSLDNAGGRVEFRVYPRPLGLAVAADISRRLADDWRSEAWWRTEVALRLWADLGPPQLWIRPEVRLSYLPEPQRLAATFGISLTPGRRAVTHYSPLDLLFEDIREPVLRDGRWLR